MKAKKRLIIVTGILSAFSLILAALFSFIKSDSLNSSLKFWTNFSFAVFGSALLGFIMSIVEYTVEKQRALEEYYLEADRIINAIARVDYFAFYDPKEYLIDFFKPEHKLLGSKSSEERESKLLFQHKKAIWEKTLDIPEPTFTEYINKQFDDDVNGYLCSLNKCINSYVELSNLDLSLLERAYGAIDFIFGNNSFRRPIFERIHRPLQKYMEEITEKAFHFRTYLKAEYGNTRVVIELIDEIQRHYFDYKEKGDQYTKEVTVYRKYVDKMRKDLEWLRSKIYRESSDSRNDEPFFRYTQVLQSHNPIPFADKEPNQNHNDIS